MKALTNRFLINNSLSAAAHGLFKALLPIAVFLLVRLDLSYLAAGIVLVSKWRVMAVKSRYWLINIKSNMVDIIVGLSFVALMSKTGLTHGLILMAGYVVWTLILRVLTMPAGMASQAIVSQSIGVLAVLYGPTTPSLIGAVLGVWAVSYFSAVHVLNIGEGDVHSPIAHLWGLFAAQLAWVLGHWQIWYWFVPQTGLILTILFGSLSSLHLLHKHEAAGLSVLRQISVSTGIITLAIIVLSDWQDKTI